MTIASDLVALTSDVETAAEWYRALAVSLRVNVSPWLHMFGRWAETHELATDATEQLAPHALQWIIMQAPGAWLCPYPPEETATRLISVLGIAAYTNRLRRDLELRNAAIRVALSSQAPDVASASVSTLDLAL